MAMDKHQYGEMAKDDVEEEVAMDATVTAPEEPRTGRRRFAVRAALGTVALAASAVLAVSLHRNQSAGGAATSMAVARGEEISMKSDVNTNTFNPYGVQPGPAHRPEDYLAGAIPEYGTVAAHFGDPPRNSSKTPSGSMPGCPGTSCNNGHLCCDKNSKCCGTSCVAEGGICCNADIGLVCSGGSMCCWGMFCCSQSFECGMTRDYSDGLKYIILKQCGGGAQFRRLSDRVNYRTQLNKVQTANETILRELVGQ